MPTSPSRLVTTAARSLLLASAAQAQHYQKTPAGLQLTTDSLAVEGQVYSPDIVRVLKFPKEQVRQKKNLVVVQTPTPGKLKISEQNGVVTVSSATTQARINQQTGQVSFLTAKGPPLVSKKASGSRFIAKKNLGEPTYRVRQGFQLAPGEAVYGLGQHQDGWLNYLGHKAMLKQNNPDIAVPVVHSGKGYGVLWANYSTTQFEDTERGMLLDSEVGDCADYYLLNGQGTADGVVARYRPLTAPAMDAQYVGRKVTVKL